MAEDTKPYFYIKYLNQDTLNDWNKVANASDEVWAFHDIELSDFWAKRKNAIRKSFIVYNTDTQPIAICPLYFYSNDWNRLILRNKRTLESFFLSGPAIKNGLNEKTRRKIINYLGKTIKDIGNSLKADECVIGISTLSKRNIETHFTYVNPLYEMRENWETIVTPYLYLNLSFTEEELLGKTETRTRSILKKMEAEKKVIVRPAKPSDIDSIWKLYEDTFERTNLPFFPKYDVEWFLNYSHSNFYVAEVNGTVASSINILTHGNSGLYFSSYTDRVFLDTETATFLLWNALKEEKKKGVIHLDLGNRPFDDIGDKKDNIARFLRGYGCELRYRYKMEYIKPTYSSKLFESWQNTIVPSLALMRVKITSKARKLLGKR